MPTLISTTLAHACGCSNPYHSPKGPPKSCSTWCTRSISELGQRTLQELPVRGDRKVELSWRLSFAEARHVHRHRPRELSRPIEQFRPFARGARVAVHEHHRLARIPGAASSNGEPTPSTLTLPERGTSRSNRGRRGGARGGRRGFGLPRPA